LEDGGEMFTLPGSRIFNLTAPRGRARHQRLSALDASFLEVESPTAHMHVGWVALFRPPANSEPPTFARLREHVATRLGKAPRYRQKLAQVPFGVHDPVWVDDPEFDIRRHVRHSESHSIDRLAETVFSTQLSREHPLWELWFADQLEDGRIGVVGKAHHCMADGIAAVELATLFFDFTPDCEPEEPAGWSPQPPPGRISLLAEAVRDRVGEELDLLRLPAQAASSPRRLLRVPSDVGKAARSLAHSFTPVAQPSSLNEPISRFRTLARLQRPLDHLQEIKRRYGTTVNDVVLAVSAGAVREFALQHDETPMRMKAMVPVNVRGDGAAGDLGNRVSFLFVELPCDEPDPVRRLEDIHLVMKERKQSGEPQGSETVLDAISYVPHRLQHALSHTVASARTYNLVVSNVPGPRQPLYMLGCPLEEVYPVIPLADDHALSIGFTTVADDAFFGVYADRRTLPDAELLVRNVADQIDDLLERARIPGPWPVVPD
jgi:diacylglycerol O-acyltransferase